MDKISVEDLYDPHGDFKWETGPGDRELFRRAYCGTNGPFARVSERIKNGFSVLTYVPGNCMSAASELVQEENNGYVWSEYGQHGEKSLADEWKSWDGITAKLRQWVSGGKRPGAVVHNLDFLSNDQGGIYGETSAKNAVACLIGGVRKGVVLGLADRDATALPEPVSRPFNEQVRVDEIPAEDFHRIIPRPLGDKLARTSPNKVVPAGAVWLIASRLRWTDPIRAVRIMLDVNRNAQTLDAMLTGIVKATQTVNFQHPDALRPAQDRISGFPPDLVATLEEQIIAPYLEWKTFTGNKKECQVALSKLPTGLILHGPAGTGKSFLTGHIAWRIGLPVRVVSGADIRAGIWGDAEKNVRNLFRDARRAAPCIIVLDDADDVLRDRASAGGSLAGAERAVVNEFLKQLQGVYGRLEGVLVILTTNCFDAIDKPIRDRLGIHCPVPYPTDREQVKKIVLSVADSYSYVLKDYILKELVDRFFLPRKMTNDTRERALEGYFSPREIETAMRMLETFTDTHKLGSVYTPEPGDLQRMLKHYPVPGN